MLKVQSIEIFRIPLTLREPYTIAYHTVSSVENIGAIVHMGDGAYGVGIAGPEYEVTGETPDSVYERATTIAEPFLMSSAFSDIDDALEQLSHLLGPSRACLALFDTALHDYAAKKANLPLYRYLGATRSSLPTFITVNIYPPEETLARARRWLDAGFRALKIKGGLDFEEDLAKLVLLRRELGDDIPLLFDANQGYSVETFHQFLARSSSLKLSFIEQPIHKELREQLAGHSTCAILADESLVTTRDATFLAQAGVHFNIKLMKTGGIAAARKLDAIAQTHRAQVIISCMDEGGLANAFGLAFSLASPQVSIVDLDSFTDYTHDPTRSAVDCRDGILYATEKPGIGFSFE